jgi:hypothetical protein
MRHVALVFAILGGAALVIIAARYGYASTDNPTDALFWGFLYGIITLGGLFGHGFALRVWRHDKRAGAFIFAVAAAAFIIGQSNSLGSMASRGNEATAKRQGIADDVEDLQKQLKTAVKEREKLQFDPADEKTVSSANEEATNATNARIRECKSGRGPACIEKEKAEEQALAKKTKATNDKAAADRAKKLDEEIIPELRGQIKKAGPVLETNSQGSALARLFGGEAKKLLTWQNLAMGTVAELLIAAAMIGYEILTQAHHAGQSRLPVPQAPLTTETAVSIRPRDLHPVREELESDEIQPLLERPKPVRQVTSQREPFGNVIDIVAKVMEPCAGSKVELKEAYFAYAEACKEQGKKPFPPAKFASEIKRFCEEARIKIHAEEDGVYLLNVRLKQSDKQELEDRTNIATEAVER